MARIVGKKDKKTSDHYNDSSDLRNYNRIGLGLGLQGQRG